MAENQDYLLIKRVIEGGEILLKNPSKEWRKEGYLFEYPLDGDMLDLLKNVSLRDDDDDYRIFYFSETIKKVWITAIEKSIKCLRFFDTREPFLGNPKKRPIPYGVSELSIYFDKYSEFESMLYGSGKYYRDHVVHVIRTWLLGLDCLLKDNNNFLNKIEINDDAKINSLEKLSIWCITALTHDLGYPLEKAQAIIDKTKDMMKSFVSNPLISMDISFEGVQNNMNDFVVRFMSSKMHKKESNPEEKPYMARLQPKYYFKFQKSLEKSKHGILSSIIIYKLLLYFLESDYSINEDYLFSDEDVRQFYIRREILRSIASHTCEDIYHLEMLSFGFLLIIVDDLQEWGRKRLSELYVNSDVNYTLSGISFDFDTDSKTTGEERRDVFECNVTEEFLIKNEENAKAIITHSLLSQYEKYKAVFRDGQDTQRRNFIYKKESTLSGGNLIYHITCEIPYDDCSKFIVSIEKKDKSKIKDTKDESEVPSFLKDKQYKEDKTDKKNFKYILNGK